MRACWGSSDNCAVKGGLQASDHSTVTVAASRRTGMGPGVTPDESKGTVAAEHASAADASRRRRMGFFSVYGGSRLKQASRLVPVECCMHPVRYNKRGRSRMQREYVEIRN